MPEPLSKSASVNGFDLHYWDWEGTGPVLVCLHPSRHYGRIWEWVAQALRPDYRVLALDQRGHGDSGRPASGNAAEDYASDVEALAVALGLDRFAIAGHSLGARTGMAYASMYPQRVTKLTLVGGPHFSTISPGSDVERWHTSARNLRSRPRRFASAAEARAALEAGYPQFSDEALDHEVRYNTRPTADGGVEWKYDPDWVADGLEHALDDLRPHAARIQ